MEEKEINISPPNPFGDGIGLRVTEAGGGRARVKLTVSEGLLNPHRLVHGGVIFAMADNGMGAALYTELEEGQSCSTIEIKINFMRPVSEGELICDTTIVHRGKTIAVLESTVVNATKVNGDKLVARAQGTFAVLPRRPGL